LTLSLKDLKSNLDILDIASKYCELKKVSSTSYKAKENPLRDEKTSSLFFYTDTQKFYDFGTDERGDVFDFVAKCENISLSDAIQRFKCEDFTPLIVPIREKQPQQVAQVVEISSEQLQREFDAFERLNITNTKHYTELLNVVPKYLVKEAQKEDVALFMSCTRYDNENDTLVMGWYKNSLIDFEMITFKRRRLNGGKWINRKSTHPNSTAFNRIYKDDDVIFIVEGARDALTSILLGLNFIAIPTTSYKNIEEINSLIKDTDVVVLICEDMQGYKSMKYLSENIKVKNSLKTFITNRDEKIDLSDFVMSCNSLKGVLNAISA
jgi:5S rRNA maturation endonuclease (ribonuclease M5)